MEERGYQRETKRSQVISFTMVEQRRSGERRKKKNVELGGVACTCVVQSEGKSFSQ